MIDEERYERAKEWDKRTPQERYDSLSRQEQTAFSAFFQRSRPPQIAWRADTEKLTPISFGKAECEWVPLDFWRYKLPGLRFIKWSEDPPLPALGMSPGSVFIKTHIEILPDGWAAYETRYDDRDTP